MGKGQQKQIFWKIPRSFSFSLRKTSLAVKIQAMHFRSGTYFSNKTLPDKCKHWSLSSFLKLPSARTKKQKNRSLYLLGENLQLRYSSCQSEQIGKSPWTFAPQGQGWTGTQREADGPSCPGVPRTPAQEEGSCCETEGNGKLFTLTNFMLCCRILSKILICFWGKISRYCHGSLVRTQITLVPWHV